MYIITHPQEEYRRYVQRSLEVVNNEYWEIFAILHGCEIIIEYYSWKQIDNKCDFNLTNLGSVAESMYETFKGVLNDIK